MQYADIVVPRGGQNRVAVQLIVEHVKDQLKQVGDDVMMMSSIIWLTYAILMM